VRSNNRIGCELSIAFVASTLREYHHRESNPTCPNPATWDAHRRLVARAEWAAFGHLFRAAELAYDLGVEHGRKA
jgi:hypothetical protein